MENLGRYQILDEIGRGGCGIVYRALDPKIGRTVAIKTIQASASADEQLRERFRREARSAGSLSHPSIVTLYEFDDSDALMFIAMEYIDGPTLADKMANAGPLPLDFVLGVLRTAADALDYAHSKNIVHRDVKPANFMMTAGGQLKMADFGIAKMQGSGINLTTTGMMIGTAQYISPEQIAAKPATGRSDQFSLAVIAYEMLTGQKPFQGDSWATVMYQIIYSEPPSVTQHRSDLGEEVTAVLHKALSKDPLLRYPTCSEFVRALTEASHATTSSTQLMPLAATSNRAKTSEVLPATEVMPTGEIASAQPPSSRKGILVGAGIAAALAAGGTWMTLSRKGPDQPEAAPTTVARTPPPLAPLAEPVTVARTTPPAATDNGTPPSHAAEPVKSSAKKSNEKAKETPVPSAAPQTRDEPSPPQAASTQSARVETPPPPAPAPVVTTPPPVIERAPVVSAPSPAPAPVVTPTPPPASTPAPAAAPAVSLTPTPAPASRADAEESRKAADAAAARRAVDDALNRYRLAFESRDAEALKAVWPKLGRSELGAIQNFFKIARTIQLQLRPSGDPEITATGATVRARRTLTATDERGSLPQQDQNVKVTLRRVGGVMVIESIEAVSR